MEQIAWQQIIPKSGYVILLVATCNQYLHQLKEHSMAQNYCLWEDSDGVNHTCRLLYRGCRLDQG